MGFDRGEIRGDKQIVRKGTCRALPHLHIAVGIELPVLVSVASEPVAGLVVPFVAKPHLRKGGQIGGRIGGQIGSEIGGRMGGRIGGRIEVK